MRAIRGRIEQPTYLVAALLRQAGERARLAALAEAARTHRTPLIATNDVLYHHPDRRMLQDVLTCIREKCTIAEAGFRLAVNSERHLKPAEEMRGCFAATSMRSSAPSRSPGALTFSLAELRYEYPDEPVPAGTSRRRSILTQLTWAGGGGALSGRHPGKGRGRCSKRSSR